MHCKGYIMVAYGLYLVATSSIARIVTVVAFEAGGRGKVDGVAITAGGSFMIDTATITTTAGMRQIEGRRAPN
jgi:hypothetical protein